ncbi:MAG: pyridoxine 5'-phosphate synthase [Muribaculaceae bacterium]|nr:pyridoxine 5'-phosphate synthase [Muribaculaceae bacterium]
MTRLSVNVNKVATLRNARGENNPDVIKFALHCESHGAEGITVHPRPDERHIRRSDVYELSKVLGTEFNIEGYPSEEFLELVASVRPTQVTLVPDKPDQLTSNAGWDVVAHSEFLAGICRRMHQCGIRVSIFVDPDEAQIVAAKRVGADRVELYTKAYADGYRQDREAAIAPYIAASAKAAEVGLGLNAGHDLSLENLRYFYERLPLLDEVSIGHALICDALYLGIDETLKRYLACLAFSH